MNRVIKKGREDASDFSRKRRSMPKMPLGLWKFNNFLRKERVFQEPLLTGVLVFHFVDFFIVA